jgi:hypothetical protein
MDWKGKGERHPALRVSLDRDAAVVLSQNLMGDRKPQSRSAFFGRKERIEDSLQIGLIDSAALIADAD